MWIFNDYKREIVVDLSFIHAQRFFGPGTAPKAGVETGVVFSQLQSNTPSLWVGGDGDFLSLTTRTEKLFSCNSSLLVVL